MADWGAGVSFAVDGRAVTWDDVRRAATKAGSWKALEADVRAGVALRSAAPAPDPAAVRTDAEAFRRERRLLSAEETEAWLEARELTVAAWHDHLAREILRRTHAAPRSRRAVGDIPELMATGWCSGAFTAMAKAAALDRLGFARWSPQADEIRHLVERRRLEWVRLDADVAVFRNDDTAREAVQCVVSDGMALDEVAAMAKVDLTRWSGLLEDLPARARTRLLPTVAGDVIGPVEHEHGAAVYSVRAKELPDISAPDVVERAGAALRAMAEERALTERVVWHEPR